MKQLLIKQKTSSVCHKHLLWMQDKWAQKMTELTQELSRTKLICFLFLFVVLSAGFLLYNIYEAFSKHDAGVLKNTFSNTSKNYNK